MSRWTLSEYTCPLIDEGVDSMERLISEAFDSLLDKVAPNLEASLSGEEYRKFLERKSNELLELLRPDIEELRTSNSELRTSA